MSNTTINLSCLTDAQIRRVLVECYVSQHPSATPTELGEHIRQFTRQQYRILGFPSDLRKARMNEEQRAALRQHEITTIKLLLSVQTDT